MTLVIVALVVSIVLILVLLYIFRDAGNAENYFNNSTSVFNIITAVGIVMSGIWAFSTFDLLNQRDIAQAQLIDLQKKAKSIESSKIQLSTEIVDYRGVGSGKDHKGLIVKVKLTNVGNKPIEFDLTNSPMKIYEIAAQGTEMGFLKLYKPVVFSSLASMGGSGENTPLDKFISLTSSERELSYFAVLPSNKMYYIVFSTQSGNIVDEDVEACDKPAGCKWFVSKYIFLK